MQNKERLVHVLKGITVGIEKCQATPLSQEVLIVWGDHNQLFLVEAFAVHRYSSCGFLHSLRLKNIWLTVTPSARAG
ncbi:hypothetical protein ZEAMMB73_Zm00001d029205 [Zea mays]|nr:hypothetical protein ZEAMMB73_Zm00001d029205 [Zea mays]